MKRFIFFLIAMLSLCAPNSLFAFYDNGLWYVVIDNKAYLSSKRSSENLGYDANNNWIEEVVIPDSVSDNGVMYPVCGLAECTLVYFYEEHTYPREFILPEVISLPATMTEFVQERKEYSENGNTTTTYKRQDIFDYLKSHCNFDFF